MESTGDVSHQSQEAVSLHPVEFSNYQCEINDGFSKYLKDASFERFGFKFNVVTILGSQSSGKSHLLNCLFGAKFETMDAKKGHSQTTKGIWASLLLPSNEKENATVVFDSEGTDSRERGEGRLTFEHRSSLFCLALSDVVVVNLWYNSLGNLTGSNYGLLKTVVEANLELVDTNSEGNSKTLLFFCVRDWTPALSPLGIYINLQPFLDVVRDYIVNKYMSSIWNEISKPQRFANLGVEALFEIRVFGLSNAVTDPESFFKDLNEVKLTWKELKPREYSRKVPSDGFLVYSSNVWKTIIEQNHLDIPTQKEMLSVYRCSEIKNAILEKLTSTLSEVTEHQFNEYLHNLLKEAEEEYFFQASRYDPSVSHRVAKELLSQLCGKLQPYFESAMGDYVKKLAVESSSLLEREFAVTSNGKELKVGNVSSYMAWPKFSEECDKLQESQSKKLKSHLDSFRVSYKGTVSFNYEFDSQPLRDLLNLSLSNECDMVRSRHLELLKQQVSLLCESNFVLVKNNLLEKKLDDVEFWDYFDEMFEQTHKNCLELLTKSYLGLVRDATKDEFEYLSLVLLLNSARDNFDKLQSNLEQLVMERFDKFFNYQEFKGELVPTEWHKQSEQDLNNKYKQSKEDALTLLGVFKTTKTRTVPPFDVQRLKKNHYFYSTFSEEVRGDYSTVLTEHTVHETTHSCSKRFLEMYKTSQVVQTAGASVSSWRNIPPVFWLFLLVLGWNEIRAVLRVVFKFQLIIPLLIILYFGFSYAANALLGPKAQKYVKPVRDKALRTVTTSVTWVVKTLHGLNSKPSPTKQETVT